MKNKFLLFFAIIALIGFSTTACGGGDFPLGEDHPPDGDFPPGGDPPPGDNGGPCAAGHDFQYTSTTLPGCIEQGFDTYTCSRCANTEQWNSVAALGHHIVWVNGYTAITDNKCDRSGCTHIAALGDPGPGGGFIFYIATAGFNLLTGTTVADTSFVRAHYLEAAPRGWYPSTAPNDPYLVWAPYSSPATGAYALVSGTSEAIGAGRKNTALIYNQAGGDRSVTAPAANACRVYATASAAAGQWFLPSRNELAQLYNFHVAAKAGSYPSLTTGLIDYRYWSSSQHDSLSAWCRNFSDGIHGSLNKIGTPNVRAVRAF